MGTEIRRCFFVVIAMHKKPTYTICSGHWHAVILLVVQASLLLHAKAQAALFVSLGGFC